MRFWKSFGYALQGLWFCLCHERNMRVHTVIAAYVFGASVFFTWSAGEYAVLCLTVGFVLAMEAVNTALEQTADTICKTRSPAVKIVKDAAAGAVLVAAMTSVAVAVFLFWEPEGFVRLYAFFAGAPWRLAGLAVSAAISGWYIVRGPGRRQTGRN